MFKINKKIFIVLGLALLTIIIYSINSADALSKFGSRGNEVTQIQKKLKQWGYYNRKC